jgi:Trypsin-co-occurring domain 1
MAVVEIENGSSRARLLIEVDEVDEEVARLAEIYSDEVRAGGIAEKVIKLSRPLFTEALDLVESCAQAVEARLAEMASGPDEVEMQLAVQMDAQVGAKIVELSGHAQLQVTMRWTGLRARIPA